MKAWPQRACCDPQSQSMYMKEGYNTPSQVPHSLLLYPLTKIDVDPSCRKYTWPNKARLSPAECNWLQAFPFQQFHVLFNSLSKVLFIFPSRYLFTIGLSPIFSFRWNLPPILSCIPKQLDSLRAYHKALAVCVMDGILTLYDALFQETCTQSNAENASTDYNSDSRAARF